jgi:3-mercaptopyruvate sulfurtransferase SseA
MMAFGLKNVKAMKGGWNEWVNGGGKIERGTKH